MPAFHSGEQVNYQYDALNRLMQAVTSDNPNVTQWGQSFTYDGFGNLTQKNVIKNQAPSLSVIVNPATNRVTQQGGSAISYDANGNPAVAYGPGGTMSLSYDGQNRLIKAGNDSYAYDPSGHREWKLIGPDQFYTTGANNDEFYMYDMAGHRVGTYKYTATINPPQGYFAATERDYWFGSRLIYRWTPTGAGAVLQDRLGSVRADSGTASDFYPYGEEKGTATANDRVKFGTYRRDADTGLDYAEQRYYSSALGRFLRPDPYGGSSDVGIPQSWNRYSYVLNDPADANDPTGMDAILCTMPDGRGGNAACSELDVAYQQYASNQNADFYQNLIVDTAKSGDQNGAQQLAAQSNGTVSVSVVSTTFAGQKDTQITVSNSVSVNSNTTPGLAIPGGTQSAGPAGGAMNRTGGGAAGSNATPWYRNSCITSALGAGALSGGVDSIGLVPEAGGIVRAIGHGAGYFGRVADETGSRVIRAVGASTSTANGLVGLGDTSSQGLISTGLIVAGFIPGAGQVVAGTSLVWDIYRTAKAIGNCE